MGVMLDAVCDACGYSRQGLRLGGSHAQIAAHDVSCYEVVSTSCCASLESVLVYMGQPWPEEARCASCEATFQPTPERRYRIATLKGEALAGHACPRCGRSALRFSKGERFV